MSKRWADSQKRPLEQTLNEVVLGHVIVADVNRGQRLEREREAREREAPDARRSRPSSADEVERRADVKGVSITLDTERGQWIAWRGGTRTGSTRSSRLRRRTKSTGRRGGSNEPTWAGPDPCWTGSH